MLLQGVRGRGWGRQGLHQDLGAFWVVTEQDRAALIEHINKGMRVLFRLVKVSVSTVSFTWNPECVSRIRRIKCFFFGNFLFPNMC